MAFFAYLLAFLGVDFCMLVRKHLFDVYMSDKGDGGGRSTVYSVPEQATQLCAFILFFCLDVRTFKSHLCVHCLAMNLIPLLLISA